MSIQNFKERFTRYVFADITTQHTSCLTPDEWLWVKVNRPDLYLAMVTNKLYIRLNEDTFYSFMKEAHATIKQTWTVDILETITFPSTQYSAFIYVENKDDLLLLKLSRP